MLAVNASSRRPRPSVTPRCFLKSVGALKAGLSAGKAWGAWATEPLASILQACEPTTSPGKDGQRPVLRLRDDLCCPGAVAGHVAGLLRAHALSDWRAPRMLARGPTWHSPS